MLKVLGLVFTLGLLLCISSCATTTNTNNTNTITNINTNTANLNATVTPTISPASPSPTVSPVTAPTTATVKGSNFKWVDTASGTNVTTIKVGGTVTWTVTGNHSLERVPAANGCADLDASFDSDRITQPVSRTFKTAGTFGYHCGVHGGTPNCTNPPASEGMAGIIIVVP